MLFDRYVMVDWSAAARPTTGRDSIWIAVADATGPTTTLNPSTRPEAMQQIDAVISESPGRVFVGVDASLGYPSGTAELFGLGASAWRSMWDAVDEAMSDDAVNRNNRFDVAAAFNRRAGAAPGPFWGAPSDRWSPLLQRTKPAAFQVPEFRRCEQLLRSEGLRPMSTWQLLGAGSVGSQTLTLLPYLATRLGQIAVWPLSTGFQVPTESVVVAEVWPTMLVGDLDDQMVRDEAQVVGSVAALRANDVNGALAGWFQRRSLSVADLEAAVNEEGWILGVDRV